MKGLEAARHQRPRREAGEAPILAARIEDVGRRADGKTEQQVGLPGPGMAAGAIHADRQIADQADAHAGRPRRRLSRREGACGEPLQEQVVAHRRGLALEIGRDRRVARVTPTVLPVAPVARVPVMQRFEQGVLAQGRAALVHEAPEVGGQWRSGR